MVTPEVKVILNLHGFFTTFLGGVLDTIVIEALYDLIFVYLSSPVEKFVKRSRIEIKLRLGQTFELINNKVGTFGTDDLHKFKLDICFLLEAHLDYYGLVVVYHKMTEQLFYLSDQD